MKCFPIVFCLAVISQQPAAIDTESIDSYMNHIQEMRKACGPVSIYYCLLRFGHQVEWKDVIAKVEVSSKGVSLRELVSLAKHFSLDPTPFEASSDCLDLLPVPSIIVVDNNHCIVYEGMVQNGERVKFFEPSTFSIRTVPREEVLKRWTGQLVLFEQLRLSRFQFWIILICTAFGIFFCGQLVCRNQLSPAK